MSRVFKKIPALLLLVFISSSCSESKEEVVPIITEYGSWNITNLTIFFDDEGIEVTNQSLLEDFIVMKTVTFNEDGTATLTRALDGDVINATYSLDRDSGLLIINQDNGENYQYTMTLSEERFSIRSINFVRGNVDQELDDDFIAHRGSILLATVFGLFDQEDAANAAIDKDPQFLFTESSFIHVEAVNY